ncbi:vanadium-dependent haloperoxidase [Streptomyces sp. NPDC126514]|uniref:vanadium-dependent haloperoxidase n=1 Tax=Streptomyces sp. NPDC126514 TaxID=3155210 RepID=UPI00332554A8
MTVSLAIAVTVAAVVIQNDMNEARAAEFNFEEGNVASEVIIPTVVPTVLQRLSGGDASLQLYTTSTTVTSWFDAIAPYSEKAVGVFSRVPRRPAAEGVNNKNRNISIMYASLRTLSATNPQYSETWRSMLSSRGLDPDDKSTDLSTPVGIGNYVGNAVAAGRAKDGFNRDGDHGGRKYNLRPYDDYTGYQPVNSPFKLTDPSRWQPKVISKGPGIFVIQKAVTPQWGRTKAFSYDDVNAFHAPEPKNSNWKDRPAAYRAQADEILSASANLTDEQKMQAEFFNDKFRSLGRATNHIRQSHGYTLEQYVNYNLTVQIAAHDAGVATWKEKYKYDAVRPFSAIRFLYGDKKLRAWGGPGKGTVDDITGNEWESYLPVADHPEYPSGSAAFCGAQAQASRLFLGDDRLDWKVDFPVNSSVIEAGYPKSATSVTFNTWSEFETACANSRVWAGVHFKSAVEEGLKLGRPIGALAFDFVNRHIQGAAAD